MTGDDSLMHSL